MTKINSPSFTASLPSLIASCLVFALFVPAFLGGCQPSVGFDAPVAAEPARDSGDTVRLSLFLNLKDPNGPGVRLEVAALEVLADQTWLPVTDGPLTLDSEKISETQIFLGGRWVPPGRYERVRFTVTQKLILGGNGKYDSVVIDPYSIELTLPSFLILEKDDSQSLFLTWDTQGALENIDSLGQEIRISLPVRQLFVDLVYAACPDINTIFVIRSDKNWVADSFGIKGQPTYLALDPDPAVKHLYVLAARESRIKIVELDSQRVIESFPISFIQDPVFMTISPDGQNAYVLDEAGSYVNRLDLATGRLQARVRLGYQPQYATYLADRDELAVSSVISQTVSFHDPLDLSEVRHVGTGDSPDGLLASNNQLYIAESGADSVSIYDLSTKTITSRITVGFSPRRLLDSGNLIYVSNYDGGSLSVIYSGQLGVGLEIHGLGRPLEMVFDQTHHWIYVGDEQNAGLAIIDSTINQLKGYVELGSPPLGLAIIE
jgi:YVTN family beta-propeller protein